MSTTEETREGFYLSEDGEWIPEGWENSTLGDLVASGQGTITTGPFGSALHAEDYVAAGIPSIMPQNIVDWRISETNIARITEQDADRLSRHRVDTGDIVFSRRGDIEKCALITNREKGWLCGTGCLHIRFGESQQSTEFIFHQLKSRKTSSWLYSNAVGATMPNLNTGVLKRLPIALPSLPEQKAIAAVLGRLDDKIELLREQNETLEALAQTLFKRWFIDFNFPDENGNPYKDSGGKMTASEFGEIPEGWEVSSISRFAKHIKKSVSPGKSPDTQFLHYSIPSFDDGMKPVLEDGADIKSNKYEVVAHSILVSKLNPGTPRIWQVQEVKPNSICSTEFQVVKPKAEYFGFVYRALKSSPIRRELSGRAHGTSSSHQRVSPADIFDVPFPASSDSKLEQQYSKMIQGMLVRKDSNREQMQTLTQLRDTLLPKLMKGEIRVPAEQ